MLKVSLKLVGGKHDGELVPLASPKFLIGRETDCHLRPNSEMVSRHHCAFSVDDYAVRLRDLGSTNGTLVNGERIRGVAQLKAGDRVTVGKLDFQVVIGDEAVPAPSGDASALQGETAQLSADETHYEVPTFKFEAEAEPEAETEPESANQTMAMKAPELQAAASPPPEPVAEQPPAAPQPQQPPPGYQYPGQYPQPGYPPYGMGFPGPMPGYYPQYQPYPQYPYPQPVMMGQPYATYPQQQQQAPEPGPAASAADDSQEVLDVRLPDPSATGLQAPQAPATEASPDSPPPPPPSEKNPSEHAADIIRQHLHRRPDLEEK